MADQRKLVAVVDEMSSNIETTQNRKRKALKLPECAKISKKKRRSAKTHDEYCWKCHQEKANVNCSKCLRSFHSSCFNRLAKLDEDGVCYVCVQQENLNFQSDVEISELLLLILKAVMDKHQKPLDWRELASDERLCYNVDFKLIHNKCLERGVQYEYPSQLIDDVEWIHHNSLIMHSEKSEIVKTTSKILKDIKRELKDASDCPECYLKKFAGGPAFVNICTPPHPLVWAKEKFSPYWPAKCLKVSKGKAHVRYFKTQQLSTISISNCLSMSKEYPVEKKPENPDFLNAEEEQQAYIDIFEDRYGAYPYEENNNTPFDPQRAEDTIREIVKREHSNRKVLFESQKLLDFPTHVSETAENVEDECLVLDEQPIVIHDVDNAVSGRLLPSVMSCDASETDFCGPSGISISNVMSGMDLGIFAPPPSHDTDFGERDPESLRRAQSRRDNRNDRLMAQFSDFIQLLFVKFWTSNSSSKNPEEMMVSKEREIRRLKSQLVETKRQLSLINADHERALNSLKNADSLLKSYKNDLNNQREKYEMDILRAKDGDITQLASSSVQTQPVTQHENISGPSSQ